MSDPATAGADAIRSALNFALDLADLAAGLTLDRFVARDFSTRIKPDGSPVTDIDLAVESALRERISSRYPTHAITGEEFGATGESDWLWYLDPIDGTSAFVGGDPTWTTLIALAREGEVVAGVVDCPALDRRWWASREGGAFLNGERVTVSTTARLSEATVSDDWHETLAQGITTHPLAAVAAQCARVRPNQGDSFLAVVSGDADVALGTDAYPWDYAPTKILIEEAGGTFTDLAGRDRIDADGAIVSNGLLHEQALATLGRD